MLDYTIHHTLQIHYVVSNHDSIVCESDIVDVVAIDLNPTSGFV